MIYNSPLELIGKTPIVKINDFYGFNNLYVKIEKFNLSGSIKDRVALCIIENAIKSGKINEETTVIEATSGSMGIALASICALKNLKCIIVMPSSMSKERISLLKAYGATVFLTGKEGGMKEAISKMRELSKKYNNSFIPSQFDNPDSIFTHYTTTAREIYQDLNNVECVVCGIGSGGSISGIGKYLKEKNKNIKIIGVEPSSSPLISKKIVGKHKIEGIGANFIPQNFKAKYVDEIALVSDDDAINCSKMMARKKGLLVGISSGAVLAVAKRYCSKFKNVVAILPDGGERYLSVEGFID